MSYILRVCYFERKIIVWHIPHVQLSDRDERLCTEEDVSGGGDDIVACGTIVDFSLTVSAHLEHSYVALY